MAPSVFAQSQGVELVSPFYFYDQRIWEMYQRAKSEDEKKKTSELLRDQEHGTVGVVALDESGNLAAGTSTGGTALKIARARRRFTDYRSGNVCQ
jgi:beta-aspartyl-peptidase (threonine type)